MPRSDSMHPALDMSIKDVDEKRAKREIANMNERRRMQNINSGFHSLRGLLPQKHDGEKLSKAAILQHTTNYIYHLEKQVTSLLSQNSELKRLVGSTVDTNTPEWIKRFATEPPECPGCKRRKYEISHRQDIDSSPLGGDGGSSTESSSEQEIKSRSNGRKQNGKISETTLRKQLSRLEKQFEEERRMRAMLEEEIYQNNKSVNQNGTRHYIHHSSLTDPTVADEVEVASESIEIEMHSCPASPPEVISMAEQQASTLGTTSSTLYISNPQHHVTGISNLEMSHKLLEQQQHSQQRVQKQANAIALPIDVPFVAPQLTPENCDNTTSKSGSAATNTPLVVLFDSNVMSLIDASKIHSTSASAVTDNITGSSNIGSTQIFHLMSSNGSDSVKSGNLTLKPQNLIAAAINNTSASVLSSQKTLDNSPESVKTSRQNLNTIVEAIRHLEGDHLFDSDRTKESPLKLKKDIANETQMLYASATTNATQQSNRINHDSCELMEIVKQGESDPKFILDSLAAGNAPPLVTNMYHSNSANIVTTSTPTFGTTRPQIIQVSRPNVIVANSVEN